MGVASSIWELLIDDDIREDVGNDDGVNAIVYVSILHNANTAINAALCILLAMISSVCRR